MPAQGFEPWPLGLKGAVGPITSYIRSHVSATNVGGAVIRPPSDGRPLKLGIEGASPSCLPEPEACAERERSRWRLHLVQHRALKNRIHQTLITFGHPCPLSDLSQVREVLASVERPWGFPYLLGSPTN